MSWLVNKLRHRLQIQTTIQTPEATGGMDLTFNTETTVWGEVKPVSDYIKAIRGAQTGTNITHHALVRKVGIESLTRAFSSAFDTSVDQMADMNIVKADWFVFMERGSSVKGRRFRVRGIINDDDRNEFVKIALEEIEETGTGWPA
jgi:head-tail adaptor